MQTHQIVATLLNFRKKRCTRKYKNAGREGDPHFEWTSQQRVMTLEPVLNLVVARLPWREADGFSPPILQSWGASKNSVIPQRGSERLRAFASWWLPGFSHLVGWPRIGAQGLPACAQVTYYSRVLSRRSAAAAVARTLGRRSVRFTLQQRRQKVRWWIIVFECESAPSSYHHEARVAPCGVAFVGRSCPGRGRRQGRQRRRNLPRLLLQLHFRIFPKWI